MFNIGFLTLVRREVFRFLALYKQTLVPSVISSGLYIMVFGQSLGSRIGPIKDVSYISYIIPGLAMMSVINNAYQNSSSSMIQSKFLRFIEDILVTPLSGLELSTSYILGGAVRGSLNGILVLFIGMMLTDLNIYSWPMTFLYIITVSWTFAALGVIIGITAENWDQISVFTNFIFMPLTFLGGVFYSIDMLPEFWRGISQVNPLYWMINGMRYATLGIYDTSPLLSLLISSTFAIVFTFVASIMFSRGYKIKV
jgi:ABC-2 type transport system permease protein